MTAQKPQSLSEEFPPYPCTAEMIAELFGNPVTAVHLYADRDMLPRLTQELSDAVWLRSLAIGQEIVAAKQVKLSEMPTVVIGFLHSIGDGLEAGDMQAFARLFQRRGFVLKEFDKALDEALAFYDSIASAPQPCITTKTHTCS